MSFSSSSAGCQRESHDLLSEPTLEHFLLASRGFEADEA